MFTGLKSRKFPITFLKHPRKGAHDEHLSFGPKKNVHAQIIVSIASEPIFAVLQAGIILVKRNASYASRGLVFLLRFSTEPDTAMTP